MGVGDKNLKALENLFESKLTVRGDELIVDGSSKELVYVNKIIQECILTFNRKGFLTQEDIGTIAKLKNSSKPTLDENSEEAILYTKSKIIKPKTENQKIYLNTIKNSDLVFAVGPAGTGKTYLAVAMAVAALKNREIERIILTRPAVEAGESLGFLPGDFEEKIAPYLHPLYDALAEMLTSEVLKKYIDQKTVEVIPLAYMRGRTINNAFIILDEAQNTTSAQMKMFLTRLGVNSKVIVTGDLSQSDLPRHHTSGLLEVSKILKGIKGIDFIQFVKEDVIRHRLVKDIVEAYDKFEQIGNPNI